MAGSDILSRREFLKLGGTGLLGLFLSSLHFDHAYAQIAPDQQGRVTSATITVYDKPSLEGKMNKIYWRDIVLPVSGIALSDDESAFNRIWYQIGTEGFAYSGSIQPVRTILNKPLETSLPEEGALAEVTVPYTDARWEPGEDSEFAYRLYYETTHWVVQLVNDEAGNPWYRLYDDKWKFHYFAPAKHLHVFSNEELSPISINVPAQLKRVEVRLGDQLVIAYEDRIPVYMARTATGGRFRTGTYSTPVGQHMTFHKRPFRHMAAGDLASNGYDLPGVPWVSYITESGVSLHGTYWHNDFGHPRSHGCINLTPQAAKWIYRWTHPVVPPRQQMVFEDHGTQVDVIE